MVKADLGNIYVLILSESYPEVHMKYKWNKKNKMHFNSWQIQFKSFLIGQSRYQENGS